MADEIKTATTGVKAQETAAPAAVSDTFVQGSDVIDEIDDSDDEINIIDEDDTPAPTGKTVKPTEEPDRNAVYADMRRRAESEARLKASQEAQQNAQKVIDTAFAEMGLTDPYTNKPIKTKAEYDAYKQRHETEKIGSELSKAGISRESLDAMIASHPALKKAETAAKAYEDAKRHEQDLAAKTHFDNQLKEITALDPTIKTVDDLLAHPSNDAIKGYVKKGISILEAFKLANYDKLANKQSQAAAQSAYNKTVSKDHLTSNAVRGQGEISMAKAQLEQYRRLTGKTDKQIREDYAKHLKKYS